MAKIVGIDLGMTYSAVAIQGEQYHNEPQMTHIIPNMRGDRTTPSVVSINAADEVIVGYDAQQNFWVAPEDTVSQIMREIGKDIKITMKGREYNPQTICAFILSYLKKCAERFLGEPVHDAVIAVPAYFSEVQKNATRDAGRIAGLNVHRLINEPTLAAIAYGVKAEEGEEKVYAVYDLGGGTLNVSVIKIWPDSIGVIGAGSDMHLGGLDMDEEVMKWALQEIRTKYGVDLRSDETAKRRLKIEAEDIKKALVVAETATFNVPYLAMIDGKPLNIDLQISRERFDMLIMPLIRRSLRCLDETIGRAEEWYEPGWWEDLDGVLLIGGPTRIHKIREMVREKLEERRPGEGLEIRADLNPDEVVAMGAAIVAAKLKPIGRPPEVDGK